MQYQQRFHLCRKQKCTQRRRAPLSCPIFPFFHGKAVISGTSPGELKTELFTQRCMVHLVIRVGKALLLHGAPQIHRDRWTHRTDRQTDSRSSVASSGELRPPRSPPFSFRSQCLAYVKALRPGPGPGPGPRPCPLGWHQHRHLPASRIPANAAADEAIFPWS